MCSESTAHHRGVCVLDVWLLFELPGIFMCSRWIMMIFFFFNNRTHRNSACMLSTSPQRPAPVIIERIKSTHRDQALLVETRLMLLFFFISVHFVWRRGVHRGERQPESVGGGCRHLLHVQQGAELHHQQPAHPLHLQPTRAALRRRKGHLQHR